MNKGEILKKEAIKDRNDLIEFRDAMKYTDRNNSQRNILLLELTLATALRVGDVIELRKENIRNGHVYVKTSKTGEYLKIALNPRVAEMVSVYIDALPEENSKLFEFGYANAWKIIKRAAEWSGIDKKYAIGTHSLRKTSAWHLYVESGYDIRKVQSLLGHKDVKVTQRYLNISEEERNETLKNMDIFA